MARDRACRRAAGYPGRCSRAKLRSIVVEVEVQAAVALVRLAPPVLGLQAQIVRRLDLAECRVDLVLQVIVGAKAVGVEVVLADADRGPTPECRRRELVADRVLGADDAGAVELPAVLLEQRRELVEADMGRAGIGDHVEIGEAQARLDRVHPHRLQELRLQQLADPRRFQPAARPDRRRTGTDGRSCSPGRAPAPGGLVDAELGEAEVLVDLGEAGAACGLVLIEQQPRAERRAVVVELDRPVDRAQRRNRLVGELEADRVVEPGRGVRRDPAPSRWRTASPPPFRRVR